MRIEGREQNATWPSPTVRYSVRNQVAVLTIDNPPVNASSVQVRKELLSSINRANRDEKIRTIVLIGAGKHFISGSDIHEFESTDLPEPQLPEVIAAIEKSPKPVVAAISGATLGGGLELALGCDWRIALEGTQVSLPEITLGMIPGAGGTQRTLRLLGVPATIRFVTSGERLRIDPGSDAHPLVDKVVAKDLEDEAITFAHTTPGKRVLSSMPIPTFSPGEVEREILQALKKSAVPSPILAAIGSILYGLETASANALAHERGEFQRLRRSPEAAALRYQFFARRSATKAGKPAKKQPLVTVGIVGAGTMGRGIARTFAANGVQVVIYDESPAAAAASREEILDKTKVDSSQIVVANDFSQLEGAGLLLETVSEDVGAKTAVLRRLEQLGGTATLATNTSYLDINVLATSLKNPSRLGGMHFFAPAHRTPVLEVIRPSDTGTETMNAILNASQIINKVPVISGVCEGFIGNRIFSAYRYQCELMLEEGALPHQIDRALESFGFAMGPFAVADMSGLDIAWRRRRAQDASRDPSARYPDVADTLYELGRLGQKAGKGWYKYEESQHAPVSDPEVHDILIASSRKKGIKRRTFTDSQVVRRSLLAMANEAASLVTEGITIRPSDIDVLLTLGYGFPAHRGGVAFWAARQDQAELSKEQARLSECTGSAFTPAPLHVLY